VTVPTSTVEQYVKTIYAQAEGVAEGVVQMKRLAVAMEVTPGTATSMVKHLDKLGLVSYTPRKGVSLTRTGRALALTMLRRHRLIETFLEQVLQYDWTEVHGDAERLEHAVSDTFVQRLDRYLGYPEVDPHGDPIPTAEGVIDAPEAIPLNACNPGREVRVVRLLDDRPSFLDLMKSNSVIPGQRMRVEEVNPTAGIVRVRHPESTDDFTVGFELAGGILVERL
jgi:DtxR family transcriptional regulator, Mn-dependent transcriptional regulator